MGVTSRLMLPYPELADRAIVPDDVRDLALALDKAAVIDQGGVASRPVSTSAAPGVRGRFYWATDESVLYHDAGTSWSAINPQLVTDGPAGTGSLRTLGTSATSATAGNDSRLSNQRVPTDASVTAMKVAPALLPSQGAGGAVEALRAIGTAAGQVVGSDDTRLSDQRTPTDSSVGWAKTGTDNQGLADQAFGIYRATDYAAGAGNIVQFDTTIYSNDASFTAGRFICTRAGLYEFNATIAFPSHVNDIYYATLWIGGDPMDSDNTSEFLHLHAARSMGVGADAYVILDFSATVRGGRALTHFNGRMIGR